MFEPGESKVDVQPDAAAPEEAAVADAQIADDRAGIGETEAKPSRPEPAPASLRQPMPLPASRTGEAVSFSSANLKLDPLTVEKIRNVALAIANLAEAVRADQEHPAAEKAEDRRVQTMLTLKGLAEVVTAIPAKAAELVKKGACISCHGEGFNKPIDPAYPKIAGQHADYLFVALKSYKTENNPNVGRSNGVMAGIAKQFSNAELKELAKYVGSLEGELKTVPQSKFR